MLRARLPAMTVLSEKSSYRHGDLKRVLLEETARILREEGEDALSLRRLAASLGVSRTAPYNHSKNKETLLSAAAEEGFSRYAAAMVAAQKRSRMLGWMVVAVPTRWSRPTSILHTKIPSTKT
jgi:AcrR family transcriptional regulator